MDIVLSYVCTFLIIFVMPILVYGLFVKYGGVKEPERVMSFMVGVVVQKIGTTLGFVALFIVDREYFTNNWLLYGFIWVSMFAIVEIGQAIGPNYSKREAAAGIVSEVIYFPLAALVVATLLR
jgi:hypothetical protein